MTTNLSPDAALSLLKDGNRRFLAGEPYTPILDRRVRLELAAAQYPIAAYLSCSDSRVPPELLFERGLGELFIVRNAGNSLCNTAIGSLEFAVINLGVPLIVVYVFGTWLGLIAATAFLARRLGIPAISTGEMLRRECQEGTPLGKEVEHLLSAENHGSHGEVKHEMEKGHEATAEKHEAVSDAHAEHEAHLSHVLHQLQNKPWAALYVACIFFLLISA